MQAVGFGRSGASLGYFAELESCRRICKVVPRKHTEGTQAGRKSRRPLSTCVRVQLWVNLQEARASRASLVESLIAE
jgi:hypothetical protein